MLPYEILARHVLSKCAIDLRFHFRIPPNKLESIPECVRTLFERRALSKDGVRCSGRVPMDRLFGYADPLTISFEVGSSLCYNVTICVGNNWHGDDFMTVIWTRRTPRDFRDDNYTNKNVYHGGVAVMQRYFSNQLEWSTIIQRL
jgi:hypothetical protein